VTAAELRVPLVEHLRRAHAAGVTLIFGSDLYLDGDRGRMARETLAAWDDAGIPPAVTLRALTSEAAALLGVGEGVGRIAPGMEADLVAVCGDPLAGGLWRQEVVYTMADGAGGAVGSCGE